MTPSLDVEVRADGQVLPGVLGLPPAATHVVVFAHGSGSSRLSPRNVAVAEAFHRDGLATLLFDLLSEDEATDRRNVFDIDLLAERLVAAMRTIGGREDVGHLPIAAFGASTGGGAAIVAATAPGVRMSSLVSRGGRPDMAGAALAELTTPTLLIVGERDADVLRLNRDALERMRRAHARLETVPGATHLFEEAGALQQVAVLASGWIRAHR